MFSSVKLYLTYLKGLFKCFDIVSNQFIHLAIYQLPFNPGIQLKNFKARIKSAVLIIQLFLSA